MTERITHRMTVTTVTLQSTRFDLESERVILEDQFKITIPGAFKSDFSLRKAIEERLGHDNYIIVNSTRATVKASIPTSDFLSNPNLITEEVNEKEGNE